MCKFFYGWHLSLPNIHCILFCQFSLWKALLLLILHKLLSFSYFWSICKYRSSHCLSKFWSTLKEFYFQDFLLCYLFYGILLIYCLYMCLLNMIRGLSQQKLLCQNTKIILLNWKTGQTSFLSFLPVRTTCAHVCTHTMQSLESYQLERNVNASNQSKSLVQKVGRDFVNNISVITKVKYPCSQWRWHWGMAKLT